ncbi:TlpA family protein disulfide reductase [Terrimonas rubra]|uniref:TlpA family protein disulfide reductase n=1 Tax=Terrimonas rubra TaxID=1035890 RepID=A0ABW6AAD5_9BACT
MLQSNQTHCTPTHIIKAGFIFLLIFSITPVFAQQKLVLLTSDKKVESLWLNVWTSETQVETQLYRLGTAHKTLKTEITATEPVRISVHAPIQITNGKFMTGWSFVYRFIPGDTVQISMGEANMPLFVVKNKARSLHEDNMEYFKILSEKQRGWSVDFASVTSHREGLAAYYRVMDSLHQKQLVSDSFFTATLNDRPFKESALTINFYRSQRKTVPADSLTIPLFEDSLLVYNGYLPYMTTYIKGVALPEEKKGPGRTMPSDLPFFNYCLVQGKGITRDKLLFATLLRIYEYEKKSFDTCLAKYSTVCMDKTKLDFLAALKSNAARDKEFLMSTKTLKDKLVSEKTGESLSFKNLLDKHKGKVVYIDFWASWCSPCIAEMKFCEQLGKDMEGQPFVIISVSLDKAFSAWKAASAKYIHDNNNSYILANPETAALIKQYNLSSIPRYLLINKEGKVVDKDAKRPSDRQLAEDIRKLL